MAPSKARPRQTQHPPPTSSLLTTTVNALPPLLLFAAFTAHVLLAPYTKVEESFNLHVVHDVLAYGIGPEGLLKYDHKTFPQPVYRATFPSLILSLLSYPLVRLLTSLNIIQTLLGIQITIRLVLGWTTALALVWLGRAIEKRCKGSKVERNLFLLLSATQFHVPFWGSRTVPNFIALPIVIYSISLLISPPIDRTSPTSLSNARLATSLLTFTTALLRAELATFLLPLTLLLLVFKRRLTLVSALTSGAVGGFAGLAASVGADWWFYDGKWVWSEMQAMVFNVVEGKSAEWGVMSKHYYLINSLPKLLLFSLPLCFFALSDPYARDRLHGLKGLMLVPSLGMVGLMSCVGHKEWRFVVYTVPCANVIAAYGAGYIWRTRRQKTILAKLRLLALVGGFAGNLFVTSVITWFSVENYPSGRALECIHATESASPHVAGEPPVKVWLPPSAAIQGASLFTFERTPLADEMLERMALWSSPEARSLDGSSYIEYNKTESLEGSTPEVMWEVGFKYVVTDQWDLWGNGTEFWKVGEEIFAPRGVYIPRRVEDALPPKIKWQKLLTVYESRR